MSRLLPPRAIWPILLLSVLARIAAALYLGDQVAILPGTFDQVSYDYLAQRVLDGHGFTFDRQWWPITPAGEPTAHWSFLYTLYLAAIYAVVDYHPLVARLIQAVAVGVLLPWGLYRLGAQTLGRRIGWWAALWSAVYIYFVYYSATLMTEMFTITAVVWWLVLSVRLARPSRESEETSQSSAAAGPAHWIAYGVLIGVAALLRQVVLLTVPVIALSVLWERRDRRAVAGMALAAVVSLVLILPVTARNYRAFDRFVLINTNAGYAFYWANHPIHGTSFQGILENESYQALIPDELRGLNEAALNDALLARSMDIIAAEPGRYLLLSVSRLEDYFKFWPSSDSILISNIARVLSFGLALPFMLYGLWLSRVTWRRCLPLYLFAGTYTALHLLSWALIRYRLPVDAVMLVFAGIALDRLLAPRVAAVPGLRRVFPWT